MCPLPSILLREDLQFPLHRLRSHSLRSLALGFFGLAALRLDLYDNLASVCDGLPPLWASSLGGDWQPAARAEQPYGGVQRLDCWMRWAGPGDQLKNAQDAESLEVQRCKWPHHRLHPCTGRPCHGPCPLPSSRPVDGLHQSQVHPDVVRASTSVGSCATPQGTTTSTKAHNMCT
ncbi:hypothetical protein SEVIR_6G178401v4 [Setaria viridis]